MKNNNTSDLLLSIVICSTCRKYHKTAFDQLTWTAEADSLTEVYKSLEQIRCVVFCNNQISFYIYNKHVMVGISKSEGFFLGGFGSTSSFSYCKRVVFTSFQEINVKYKVYRLYSLEPISGR